MSKKVRNRSKREQNSSDVSAKEENSQVHRETTIDSPPRKSKPFKKIGRFLRGRVKKGKKSASPSPEYNKQSSSDHNKDSVVIDTGTGLNGNNRYNNSSPLLEGRIGVDSTTHPMRIVLLLVDPESRLFEILQLEFDSNEVLVSEVLSQISSSVTEEIFVNKSYLGVVCGSDGIKKDGSLTSNEKCKTNDILAAIPSNSCAKEIAQLAIPILSDDNIVEMFASNGFDVSAWNKRILYHKSKGFNVFKARNMIMVFCFVLVVALVRLQHPSLTTDYVIPAEILEQMKGIVPTEIWEQTVKIVTAYETTNKTENKIDVSESNHESCQNESELTANIEEVTL